MKRKVSRKRQSLKERFGNVDPKGYLDSNREAYSPYKVIPSNQITMKGVSENIMAFPFSEGGEALGSKLMRPEEEFTFPDASYVVEVPESEMEKFQAGGGIGIAGIQALRQQSEDAQSKLDGMSEANNEIFQNKFEKNTLDIADPKEEPFDVEKKDSGDVDLFNPYGGFDVPTAAFTLGQGIEQGNVGQTVASGAKLITGLGRNLMSGLASERRNQFVLDEYNQRQKDDLTRTTTLQEGGKLNDNDLSEINKNSEFQFNLEGANQLFERVEPTIPQQLEEFQPNLGRYKDVGYFDFDKLDGDTIKLRTTSKNPHNSSSVKQLIPSLQKMNPGKKVEISYVPKAQEGGNIEKILTEGFVQGIDNENFKQPNVEVEAGEHIDSEGKPVKEVLGKKHSQGGEKMQLEEGDRVLSDYLKLGGKHAKHVRDVYGVDVKAKDTYATVLDKFKKSSGLTKILNEKEELIKEIDKQKEIKDESTSGLNLQFLSKKLNELNEKQNPLETEQKFMFDDIFALQEASKPKEKKPSQEEEFQLGGTKFNSDQVIQMGGSFNLSPEDSLELFKQFKKGGKYIPSYQDGDEFGSEGQGLGFVPEGQSQDPNSGLFGKVDKGSFEETMLKNPWFNWRSFDPNNPNDVLKFQKQFNKLSTDGQQIREDGKFGEQTQSVQLPFTQTNPPVLQDNNLVAPLLLEKVPTITPEEQELDEVEKRTLVDERGRLDAVLLPDQYPIAPDAMQPHLKNQRRFDRIDPNLISPEQQIEEINRNRNQTVEQINNLPDNQRRAALATLNANTNNQLNQVIQQTNRTNSQIKTQADLTNLQQSNAEENFLATDALDFERRQLTALAKTQNDIRNYFNQLNRIQVGNFNTINDLNLLNDMNDDFQFTGSGVEKTTENPVFTDAPARKLMLQRQGVLPADTTKKKYGGSIKKRRPRKKK